MNEKLKNLGKKIKELREEQGLTQKGLAQKLYLEKSTIAKYETGEIVPSPEVLMELALFFKVRTDYLLGLED